MAGLQRFISYIYKYEKDEKKANAGFAKVEVRGSICRMEVHIRGLQTETAEGAVYLFARSGNYMRGIPVGGITLSRGNIDVRYMFETRDLQEFHVTMEQMEGMYIPISKEEYLASQWKEGDISQKYFRVMDKGEVFKEHRKEEEEGNKTAAQEQEAASELVGEEEINDKAVQEEETESDLQASIEEPIHTTELPMEKPTLDDSWAGTFKRLRLQQNIFYPFEGRDIECLRMEVKDIKEFPEKYWYFGNNSFLLHGFFNYGHFIFGEMHTLDGTEYLIGVPGIFLNQERIMASMFGFPEFQTAEALEQKTGNFGYWYRII